MEYLKYVLYLFMASVVLNGCATGHCHGVSREVGSTKNTHLFVFKPEGSKQCKPGSGIPIDKVAEDLTKIQVFTRDTRSDGKIHLTLCGADTGRIHVFEILVTDKAAALAAGFQELKVTK